MRLPVMTVRTWLSPQTPKCSPRAGDEIVAYFIMNVSNGNVSAAGMEMGNTPGQSHARRN